jgi:hypothetical protein
VDGGLGAHRVGQTRLAGDLALRRVGLLLSRFCFEQALLSIQPPPSDIELAVLFSPTMLSIIGTHRAAIDSYSSCSRFSFPAAATLYSEARKHDTQLKYEMPSTHERYS